jgi:hypothetical protein
MIEDSISEDLDEATPEANRNGIFSQSLPLQPLTASGTQLGSMVYTL